MIIKCFRCGKEIDRPGLIANILKDDEGNPILNKKGHPKFFTTYNANYVVANDTKMMDDVDVIYAVDEKGKRTRKDTVDIARKVKGTVRVETVLEKQLVQKTGIICPDCYQSTDTVIWGIHKNN